MVVPLVEKPDAGALVPELDKLVEAVDTVEVGDADIVFSY